MGHRAEARTGQEKDRREKDVKFFPIDAFPSNRSAAWFWAVATVCLFVVNTLQPVFVTRFLRSAKYCIPISGENTIHLSPLKNYDEQERLLLSLAKQATFALLSRSPAGTDCPEFLESFFQGEAKKQAARFLDEESFDFQKKEIHQKVEFAAINALSKDAGKLVIVKVEGQLIRTGLENRQVVPYQGQAFDLRIFFRPNRNVYEVGRIPFVVEKFTLKKWNNQL